MFNKIIETVGLGPKKFNCGTCHESFSTRKILSEHKAASHPDVELSDWEKK